MKKVEENNKNIKQKILKILIPILAILAFLYVPAFIYLFLKYLKLNDIIAQLIADFIYLVIIVFIFRKSLKKDLIDYKNNFNSYIKIGLKGWMVGIAIMIVSNLILNIFIFKGNIAGNEEAIRDMLYQYPIYIAISSIIFAPIAEEITFRKILRNSINTKWVYILLSGFIFGFLHALTDISTWLDLLYIIPYGALGSVFAYMNYKTDNIFTSIVIHFLHNFITIVLLLSVASTVV